MFALLHSPLIPILLGLLCIPLGIALFAWTIEGSETPQDSPPPKAPRTHFVGIRGRDAEYPTESIFREPDLDISEFDQMYPNRDL